MQFLPVAAAEAIFCAGVAALIPLLTDPDTDRRLRWLRRPAAALAAMSYSLYLFHYPINALIDPWFGKAIDLGPQALGLFCLRIIVVLVLVIPAYFAVEGQTPVIRRLLRRGLRMAKKEIAD